MVMSSLSQLVTNTFFQSHLVTWSNRHIIIPSQASTVQSCGWAMLNYAGETGEVGNGYTASFAAAAIFRTPYN